MSDFQLYKKRDFSAYITDTFQFIKLFGKNYFLNYIVINGALLLVVAVIYYFFYKDWIGNINNVNALETWFYDENIMLFFLYFIIGFLVLITYYVFSTAFPMVYLHFIDSSENDKYTASALFSGMKSKIGRILQFGLISIFIFFPIITIFSALSIALSFILIGIPLLVLGVPALMVWSMQSLFIYANENTGYFEALGKAWKTLFSSFWNIVGSTIIIMLGVGILSGSFSMISAFISVGSIITSGGTGQMVYSPLSIAINLIGMLVSYLLYNLIYVQQGLVYYSSLENTNHVQAFSEIDNIGNNNEE